MLLALLYFKMWLWILIGLGVITKANGYSDGDFPASCQSMSPDHHGNAAQSSEPPYEVTYELGESGEPITVILQSKATTSFVGFMLEARVTGMVDESPPVGTFTLLDTHATRLLACGGQADSAVSQKLNHPKSVIKVKWTAPEEELNITFRATFVQSYRMFWERVDTDVILSPTTTAPPTTTTSTMKPTTATTTTKPTTATTTTKPTTATTTTEPIIPNCTWIYNNTAKLHYAGTALMAFNINFGVLKTTQAHIVTATVANSFCSRRFFTVSVILCRSLCAAIEISSLMLFALAQPCNVKFVALVCVVLLITFIEVVTDSVSVQREQKKICKFVVKACPIINLVLSTASVFIGVLEIVDCRETRNRRTESWLLIVMIAYTVWISLFVIWAIAFIAHKHTVMGRSKTGSSRQNERWSQQREERTLSTAVKIVTAILIVGTIPFTTTVIAGIVLGKPS